MDLTCGALALPSRQFWTGAGDVSGGAFIRGKAPSRDRVLAPRSRETQNEKAANRVTTGKGGWQRIRLGGVERVSQTFFFEPFDLHYLITERTNAFYQSINQIYFQNGLILAASALLSILLLLALLRLIL